MKTWAASCTFVLFVLYPMLSGPSLEVFHCVDIGNRERRLKGGLENPCPADHPGSRAFILGLLMVILYPFGILVLFFWLMQVYRIPQMSKFKLDEALVHGLIVFYKKSQADTLAVKVALEIGGAASLGSENVAPRGAGAGAGSGSGAGAGAGAGAGDSSPQTGRSEADAEVAASQFKARVKLLYEGATNGGREELNAARLRHYVHQLGIRGADERQLDNLFYAYDDDGNGTLECEEFEIMIREISEHCHLFRGTEGKRPTFHL
jgi:hypothetical protein